jgi:signal transduction histidine kinase
VRTRVAVPIVGVLLATGILAVSLTLRQSPLGIEPARDAPLNLIAAWSLIAAGVAVAVRRPGCPAAALLMAAGLSWGVGSLATPAAGTALGFSVGLLVGPSVPGLVVAATVALHPDPARRTVMLLAAAGCLIGILGVGLLPGLWLDPAAGACSSCVDNLFATADVPERHATFTRIGLAVAAIWAVTTVGALIARPANHGGWRSLSAPPILATCGYLLIVAVADVRAIERGFVGSVGLDRALVQAQALGLVALAAAVGLREVMARRRKRRTARLMLDLGRSAVESGVGAVLGAVLGDPSLRVGYPDGNGALVNRDLEILEVPPGHRATPVTRGGQPVAMVLHRPGRGDASEALDDAVTVAGLALDRERLEVELALREAQLRQSRTLIVEAADRERERLERDLHDGAQQRLVALLVRARLLGGPSGPGEPADEVRTALIGTVRAALDGLRRVSHRLSPPALTESGLAAALDSVAEEHAEVLVDAGELGDRRLPDQVERTAYWISSELCREGASCIVARYDDGALRLDVELPAMPECWPELGDRVGALDGAIQLDRNVDNAVHIEVRVPCG